VSKAIRDIPTNKGILRVRNDVAKAFRVASVGQLIEIDDFQITPINIMFGSFLPNLWSSCNQSVRSREPTLLCNH